MILEGLIYYVNSHSVYIKSSGFMNQYKILFICTHNSARSILAEALASTHPSGLFIGYSAGSNPANSVNPIVAELTKEMGFDSAKLLSKSWDLYGLPDAPKMDFIITLSNKAAGEVNPVWPGSPTTALWDFPDPSQVQGTNLEKKTAFISLLNGLEKRIDILSAFPLNTLNSISLREIHVKA